MGAAVNQDLKQMMKVHHVKQWQLADVLGIHETTMCRRLRHELTESEKKYILGKLNELILKKEGVNA